MADQNAVAAGIGTGRETERAADLGLRKRMIILYYVFSISRFSS